MYKKEFPQISETVEELRTRMQQERHATIRQRLHLLLLIRSGQVQSRLQAAKHLAVHRNSVGKWLARYENGGLADLLISRRPLVEPPAEQKTLSPPVLQKLRERLDSEGFASYREIQRWLHQEFEVTVAYRTVHRLVRERLKAKLKRARPRHVKKTTPTPPASLPS